MWKPKSDTSELVYEIDSQTKRRWWSPQSGEGGLGVWGEQVQTVVCGIPASHDCTPETNTALLQ